MVILAIVSVKPCVRTEDDLRAQTNTLYASIPIYHISLAFKLSYQME